MRLVLGFGVFCVDVRRCAMSNNLLFCDICIFIYIYIYIQMENFIGKRNLRCLHNRENRGSKNAKKGPEPACHPVFHNTDKHPRHFTVPLNNSPNRPPMTPRDLPKGSKVLKILRNCRAVGRIRMGSQVILYVPRVFGFRAC